MYATCRLKHQRKQDGPHVGVNFNCLNVYTSKCMQCQAQIHQIITRMQHIISTHCCFTYTQAPVLDDSDQDVVHLLNSLGRRAPTSSVASDATQQDTQAYDGSGDNINDNGNDTYVPSDIQDGSGVHDMSNTLDGDAGGSAGYTNYEVSV
jgi:hypothetical protein